VPGFNVGFAIGFNLDIKRSEKARNMLKLAQTLPRMSSGPAIYAQLIEIRTNSDKEHVNYVARHFGALRTDMERKLTATTWLMMMPVRLPQSTPKNWAINSIYSGKKAGGRPVRTWCEIKEAWGLF
jgi:hypothetical protein